MRLVFRLEGEHFVENQGDAEKRLVRLEYALSTGAAETYLDSRTGALRLAADGKEDLEAQEEAE